jgi:hypothetical protein
LSTNPLPPNNPGFNDPLARIDDPTLHCVHIEITELKSPAPIDNTEIQDSLNDVTFVKSRTPELSTQEGTSQLSNCLTKSLQVSDSCGATGSSFYKGFKLDANAIVLKAGTDVLRMYMSKDSGAGRNRMMILCQICKEYEEEAIRWSRNGVVYLANGIRCDGEKKLKEVVDHLLSSSHKAVLEKKKCQPSGNLKVPSILGYDTCNNKTHIQFYIL